MLVYVLYLGKEEDCYHPIIKLNVTFLRKKVNSLDEMEKAACFGWLRYSAAFLHLIIYIPTKKASVTVVTKALREKGRLPTLPHCIAVPSAQVGLTSLFGMGRGGTPPQ